MHKVDMKDKSCPEKRVPLELIVCPEAKGTKTMRTGEREAVSKNEHTYMSIIDCNTEGLNGALSSRQRSKIDIKTVISMI
jgi:hypothetical protein